MRLRILLIGSLALVFGGSAAAGAYLLTTQPTAPSEVETVEIVVAASDAPRGTMLSAEQLTLQMWPEGCLPRGVALPCLPRDGDGQSRGNIDLFFSLSTSFFIPS